MAQYGVGHLEKLQRIESLRRQMPGLALAGNGYNGIGVPDCIRSGMLAADEAVGEVKDVNEKAARPASQQQS